MIMADDTRTFDDFLRFEKFGDVLDGHRGSHLKALAIFIQVKIVVGFGVAVVEKCRRS